MGGQSPLSSANPLVTPVSGVTGLPMAWEQPVESWQLIALLRQLHTTSFTDEGALVAHAVALLRELLVTAEAQAPDVSCYLVEPASTDLVPYWHAGLPGTLGATESNHASPEDAALAAQTAVSGQPSYTNGHRDTGNPTLASLRVPIANDSSVLGVLIVSRPTSAPFNDEDIAAVEVCASSLALALANLRLRARLQIEEERARDLVEYFPDAVILHTDTGAILAANSVAGELLGREPAALIGSNISDYLPEVTPSTLCEQYAPLLDRLPDLPGLEIHYRRANGEQRIAQTHTRRLPSAGLIGPQLYQTTAHDITTDIVQRGALEARVRELDMLIGVSESLNSTLDLETVLGETLRALTAVVSCPTAAVRLYNAERRSLTLVGTQGWPPDEQPARELDLDTSAIGLAVRAGEITFVADVHDAPAVQSFQHTDIPRAMLIVPIMHGSAPLGCITLLRPHGTTFTERERGVAAAVARQTAIAIENARLFGRVRQHLHQITELQSIVADLVADLDLEPTLARICRTVADLLGAQQSGVRFLSDDGATLTLVAQYGLSPELAALLATTPAHGRGDAVQAVQTRDLIVTADLAERSPELPARDYLLQQGIASICTVPIAGRDQRLLGVLFAAWPAPHEPTAEDREIVRTYANFAAVAIGNARLYQRTRELYLAGIQSLAAAVDARDAYTHRHSRNVAFYARELARELALPQAEVETIELAALLHDIGKIGIADAILAKPGRLSTGEMSIMITHAQQGAAILAVNEAFAPLVPLVKHHHEWYGGGGYPDGLVGDAIPLGAAIIAVADAFDTMTTDRAYRRARSLHGACAELRHNAGRQFHPRVVDALMRVLERDATSSESYIARLQLLGTGLLREPLTTLAEAVDVESDPAGQIHPYQLKELAVLHHLARSVGTIPNLNRFLTGVVEMIRQQLGYDNCAIALRDDDDYLTIQAVSGFATTMVGQRLAPGEGAFSWVVATGQTRNVANVERDPLYASDNRTGRSALLAPLISEGRPIGVIATESQHTGAFSADDEILLETVANQVAAAIAVARLHDEKKRAAITDGLTGVYNHRYFYQRLEEELAALGRADDQLALVIFDVNGLKALNDTHGHLAGDTALRAIATTLRDCIRERDIVARYGGDEFALILPGTGVEDARRIVTRVRARLLGLPGQYQPLSLAAGIAICPADGRRAPALVAAADKRMYAQKHAGHHSADQRAETRQRIRDRLASS
jgi:diguanylate cyclase (GGDEF)-like protein/PAS domain S-box-containing protein/putative nucleotidyltransferase with HDIG domain